MDWIKVKNVHTLDEYTDMSDAEFRAWIKIMSLTARLEHEPSEKQLTDKRINPRTVLSLENKLKKHRTSLDFVLNKVRLDVEKVLREREYSKTKKQEYRAVKPPVQPSVHIPVQLDGNNREEKRREEKNIDKELKADNERFTLPSKEEINEASKPKILASIETLSKYLYESNIFPNIHGFKNQCFKNKANLRAVAHTLTRCVAAKPSEPWAYCIAIMKKEDGNFNARDYAKSKG